MYDMVRFEDLKDGYILMQLLCAEGVKNYLYFNGECISVYFVGESSDNLEIKN